MNLFSKFSPPREDTDPDHAVVLGQRLISSLFTAKLVYTVFLSYYQARFVHNRVIKLGDRLFTAYMRAPYSFHLGRNSAELLRNVNNECANWEQRTVAIGATRDTWVRRYCGRRTPNRRSLPYSLSRR